MLKISGSGHRRKHVEAYKDEHDIILLNDVPQKTNQSQEPEQTHRAKIEPNITQPSKAEEAIELRARQLKKDVATLSSRTDLTPKEVDLLRQKQEIVQAIDKEKKSLHHYDLPRDYRTISGAIDRKRKQELFKITETVEPEKKPKFENQWETEQLKKAQEILSANPDQIELANQKLYDYVFDETQLVDYSEESELPGEEGADQQKPTYSDIQSVRKSLPAYKYRQSFLDIVAANQVIVVVGETGSGKTTQLPQYLYEAGYHKGQSNGKLLKIGCTQPRRVAATSVARRVAEEVGCSLGQEVGYSIRFEDESSNKTIIKYLTDGMLLREFISDPLLSTYSCLMIDEAHERTVSTEIVLSLLKDILLERKDLKLIIASATINASKFSDYFNKAPVFRIPGRRFPVNICYTKNPEANYIQAAITTVLQIHTKEDISGDILVFLTGQEEIEMMEEALNDARNKLGNLIKPLIVAPIYANLPPKLQAKIFEPTPVNSRKVVLATNIAETSITIDGIKFVIDPGFVKENVFNPSTGMESLVVVPCSRASADQRAGRAGRVGPGKCFRLFTKWSFYNELPENGTPEILRANLSSVILLLLSIGITDLVNFDFMDPPSHQTLIRCLELLYALGALNAKGQLTETGRKMAAFPMDPMFCKAILTSAELDVTNDVLSIISMLSESSSLFYRPKDKKELADKRKERFYHEAGDHVTLLNIWNQWKESGFSNLWCEDNFLQYRTLKRIKEVRGQLEKLCIRVGVFLLESKSKEPDVTKVQQAILSGFFTNVARLLKLGNSYVLLKKNQPMFVHPSSRIYPVKPPPKFILYHELVLTSKEYMRNCLIINEKWIDQWAGHYYRKTTETN